MLTREDKWGVAMANLLRKKTYKGAIAMWISIAITFFIFSGCGGHYQSKFTEPEAPEENVGAPTSITLKEMIHGESYAGELVVHFKESLKVRLSQDTQLYSAAGLDGELAPVQGVLDLHPTAELKRVARAPAEEVDAARARLERLSGKKLADFNSIYHLKADDPEEAFSLLQELKGTPGVEKVYPRLQAYPSSLDTTPSLVEHQTYLLDEAVYGGLNAQAAWDAGVKGEGVYVVDNELGVNFDHEDLGLVADHFYNGGNYINQPYCAPGIPPALPNCDSWITHGTAVAGIMVAQDNGHGVTGFAPDAYFLHATMDSGTSGMLRISTDGIDDPLTHGDDDIEPGTIWVIEVQLPGKYTVGGCGGQTVNDQYGCVPTELWPEDFAAIQQATAYGVTVVSASGNGQMDFDNEDLYTGQYDFAHNLAHEDAGSIMVGASWGANESMIFYSNCGSRVNSFAWGQGVVTTGYSYGMYGWYGITPPVPPNDETNSYFIDNFGGTSSAAALVGGAAALVQSYVKQQVGPRRYLMPVKVRELIVGSGVAQADGGCNIGTQPRLDVAMNLVDAFLTQVRSQYPELDSGELLTVDRMISMRQAGIGIICKPFDPINSDPICPDTEIYLPGSGIGKALDFDADGRADLIQWTNGTWKIALSGMGEGEDNYGVWDVEITHPPIDGQWVWPYVADMNSDGRTDFVVYDKENGTWYIAFTDTHILRDGTWHGWDWVLDYSSEWQDDLKLNPDESNYSRPAIGKYDNDEWLDIAIACSDGYWRIDYGGPDQSDYGTFDEAIQYLSAARLADAPGWAYPTIGYKIGTENAAYLVYKVPDGLPEEGRLVALTTYNPGHDYFEGIPYRYGGNDLILAPGKFDLDYDGDWWAGIGVKDASGGWPISFYEAGSGTYVDFEIVPPDGIYGGPECHPIVADFDGDDHSDRAVMCPDEWRMAYSSPDLFVEERGGDGARRVPLGYDITEFSLPGRSYAGGISYTYVRQLIQFFQELNPGVPPPIPVDMAVSIAP